MCTNNTEKRSINILLEIVEHNGITFYRKTVEETGITSITHGKAYDLTAYHYAVKDKDGKYMNIWHIHSPNGDILQELGIPKEYSEQEENEIVMDWILNWDKSENLTFQFDDTWKP